MTDTIEIVTTSSDPDDLAIELASYTTLIKQRLGLLVKGIQAADNPRSALAIIEQTKAEIEVLESQIAVAVKQLADSADVIKLLTVQRNEAYQELEEVNPDYDYENLAAFIRDSDAESRAEDEEMTISDLKKLGNTEGADLLKAKLDEARKLQEEADKLLEQAMDWVSEQER